MARIPVRDQRESAFAMSENMHGSSIQAGHLYSWSQARRAQTVRAVLLARATAALLAPRSVLSRRIQRPRGSVRWSARRTTDRAPWIRSVQRVLSPRCH